MKFCSYNFVLNEVPNYNDVTQVANIMLNEAPNSNDITCLGNNVCLTALGAQKLSIAANSHHAEKPTYQRREMMNDNKKVLCGWK